MTAPQRALQANSRGIAVLIAAVVVGFLLLTQAGAGGGGSSGDEAAPPPTTEAPDTTTTTDLDSEPDETTPDTSDEDPGDENGTDEGDEGDETDEPAGGETQVAVLNASGINGLAATTMDQVEDAGYGRGFVGNAPGTDSTAIYYRAGHQAEATALASLFGKSSDIVEALSSPFEGTTDADVVVVVIGGDFQG